MGILKTICLRQAREAAASAEHSSPERGALAGLSLTMLLSSLGTSIANIALPTLAVEFMLPLQRVQWIVLAYLLGIITLIVSAGRLGDLTGRRRLLLTGILLFTAASSLCGIATRLWVLIAARFIQGLGAAVMMALTMAFVSETVPQAKTGRAMGLLGTMSAVGTALGPSLGGVLIAAFGWRAIFFINVPLGILALLLAYYSLPSGHSSMKTGMGGFDYAGTLLLALMLTAYALAITSGRGNFGLTNLILLLAAGCGACLFTLIELKTDSPLIQLTMFRNPVLSAGFVMSALVTAVVMATLVAGPFYLTGALALGATRAGFVMSFGPIVAALVGVPAGRLTDKFGTSCMTITGLIAMAAGCGIVAEVPTSFGIVGYAAPIAVTTAGYALFQAANNTAVMTSIVPEQRGIVSGMLNLSRNLGLISGASIMAAVFALGSGTTGTVTARPEDVVMGMRMSFATATGMIAIAIIIASISNMLSRRSVLNCAKGTALGLEKALS